MTALFIWFQKIMIRTDVQMIELLSPAGDYESFLAAVHAGADAVYAGGDRFGARAYAKNLNKDELCEAIDYAHLHGKRFYLTVNTILKNKEMEELCDYIAPLYETGLDAVIIQDIGVLSLLSREFPGLSIHASTQMAVTDSEGINMLKELGVQRVVPARELSLSELKYIFRETGIELECFIHGAMCYSYSGKCLFSSIAGGRSGNRGRCAQPCRLPYNKKYSMSMRDMNTLKILPDLIDAGIASFKIEGRMKSAEYVAGVTGIYRKYIDRYIHSKDITYSVDEEDIKTLNNIYTRSGNCQGYYYKHNGREMISVDKPSYSTMDKDELKKLYDRYAAHTEKIRIQGSVTAKSNEPLKIELTCSGHKSVYYGGKSEPAQSHPTEAHAIKKQINRLGDTCFKFSALDVYADKDIFLPVSLINRARREAVRLLENEILSDFRRNRTTACEKSIIETDESVNTSRSPFINCRIDREYMLDSVLEHDFVNAVTIDAALLDQDSIRYFNERVHDKKKLLFIALPMIIRNRYFKRNPHITEALCRGVFDGVLADNYESLYHLKLCGYRGVVISDLHLYCANNEAVSALGSLGVNVMTYPVELNSRELASLKCGTGEFILYGRLPMMVSAQCTQKTKYKCIHDNGTGELKDRFGNIFMCVRNCSECYTVVLNCVPNMLTSLVDIPQKMHPYSYRIHFTIEDNETVNEVLDYYNDILIKGIERNTDKKHTLGHLKRGVE